MTNDNVLLITFGEPGDGLNNFTITGRDWIKLEKWMKTFRIDDCYGVNNYAWYEVARDITPRQQLKFHTLLTKKEAEEFIIEYIGEENWRECVMERAKEKVEEKVEEEMNECEICGSNMTEENTRYVEDGDTIIMCDKCEE